MGGASAIGEESGENTARRYLRYLYTPRFCGPVNCVVVGVAHSGSPVPMAAWTFIAYLSKLQQLGR